MQISAVNACTSKKGKSELDSHADTCASGVTQKVIDYTDAQCDVYFLGNESAFCHLKEIKIHIIAMER